MALFNDPINASQRASRELGYTGQFGEGGDVAFKKGLSPEQQALHAKLMQKYSTQFDNGGVATVGQIEPFNVYQRSALEGLGAPVTAGNALLQQAGDVTTRAAQPFSMGQYNTMQQGFMNPYQQQVVDASINAINQEAARTGNALTGNMGARENRGGALSFGDSASAIQRAELERNRLNTVANTASALNQAGYTQAQNAALNTMQNDVTNALNASPIMATLAQQNRTNALGDLSNRLLAGDRIQAQNQNALGASWNEYNRLKGYGQNQLSQLGGNLNMFPMSQSSTGTPAPNNMGILGGGLMSLGGAFGGGYGGVNNDLNALIATNTGGIF